MRLTPKALEYFEQAAEICRRVGARQELALALGHIANIHRQQHNPGPIENYLKEAIAIYEKSGDLSGLAAVYGEYGCEYRKRGREQHRDKKQTEEALTIFTESERYFRNGLDYAQRGGNTYREADILVDLALLEYYRYDAARDEKYKATGKRYLDKAEKIARKYHHVLWEGRSKEIRGDFDKIDGDLKSAFITHYAEACILLAPYSSARFHETIERTQKAVHKLGEETAVPPEDLLHLLTNLIRVLEASGSAQLKDMINDCEAVSQYIEWRTSDENA